MIATLPRLTKAEITEKYNGRWVLLTELVRATVSYEWQEAVVLADAPPEDNSTLFELKEKLSLRSFGILFMGENPYKLLFLL